MTGISSFINFLQKYISFDSIPRMVITDYVEILILSFLIYEVLAWIKDTKAWSLLRGIIVIALFIFLAYPDEHHNVDSEERYQRRDHYAHSRIPARAKARSGCDRAQEFLFVRLCADVAKFHRAFFR